MGRTVEKLHKELLKAVQVQRVKTGMSGGVVELRINSYGGSLTAGFASYDFIRGLRIGGDVHLVGV